MSSVYRRAIGNVRLANLNHDDGFASLTLGASFQVNESLAFAVRYRGDFARDTDEENAVSVGFELRF